MITHIVNKDSGWNHAPEKVFSINVKIYQKSCPSSILYLYLLWIHHSIEFLILIFHYHDMRIDHRVCCTELD